MNAKQFFDHVVMMRQFQKEYFKTRSQESLQKSKAIENEIDAEIKRVNNILANRQQAVQGNLFEPFKDEPCVRCKFNKGDCDRGECDSYYIYNNSSH